MDKAVNELEDHSPHFWRGLVEGMSSVSIWEWWSSVSETGTMGAAKLATKEKGGKFLEAAIEGIIAVVREYAQRPIPQRVDHRPKISKE